MVQENSRKGEVEAMARTGVVQMMGERMMGRVGAKIAMTMRMAKVEKKMEMTKRMAKGKEGEKTEAVAAALWEKMVGEMREVAGMQMVEELRVKREEGLKPRWELLSSEGVVKKTLPTTEA